MLATSLTYAIGIESIDARTSGHSECRRGQTFSRLGLVGLGPDQMLRPSAPGCDLFIPQLTYRYVVAWSRDHGNIDLGHPPQPKTHRLPTQKLRRCGSANSLPVQISANPAATHPRIVGDDSIFFFYELQTRLATQVLYIESSLLRPITKVVVVYYTHITCRPSIIVV